MMNQITEQNRNCEASGAAPERASAARPLAKLALVGNGRSRACRDLLLLLHADFALFQPGAVCDRHATAASG